MKIAVVNYNEFNKCPGADDVVSDVTDFYRSCIDVIREDLGCRLNKELADVSLGKTKCEIVFVPSDSPTERKMITRTVGSMDCDLLVTYNLAGFELETLTDGLSYNLLNCRQIHFVDKEEYFQKDYYKKIRSINMFICDRTKKD